jgi:hypothetical protein
MRHSLRQSESSTVLHPKEESWGGVPSVFCPDFCSVTVSISYRRARVEVLIGPRSEPLCAARHVSGACLLWEISCGQEAVYLDYWFYDDEQVDAIAARRAEVVESTLGTGTPSTQYAGFLYLWFL